MKHDILVLSIYDGKASSNSPFTLTVIRQCHGPQLGNAKFIECDPNRLQRNRFREFCIPDVLVTALKVTDFIRSLMCRSYFRETLIDVRVNRGRLRDFSR